MSANRAERRRMEKLAKKVGLHKMKGRNTEPTPLPEGHWEIGPGFQTPEQPREPDQPGINCPPVLAYHNQMVETNTWYNVDKLDEWIKTIKQLSNEEPYEEDGNTLKPGAVDWSWARNHDCKYVDIRIDMRDGGFVVMNRDGKRICLEQLLWQYQFKK